MVYISKLKNVPGSNIEKDNSSSNTNSDIKWIDFKIKNNSWKRNHFVVTGPKKDGTSFSYGFSLLPYKTRKERWSTGTQVFKEKKSGSRELLITISANNEAKLLNLFN